MNKIKKVFILIMFSLILSLFVSTILIFASETSIGKEIAHYTFENKNVGFDFSSNYNDASNSGVSIGNENKVNPDSGNYGVFATNKYMTIPNVFTGNFTISMWARPSSLNDYQRLFDFGKGDYYIALYQYSDGNIGICYNTGGGNVNAYATPGIVKVNEWAHYLVIVDGSKVMVYVNNVNVLTVNMPKTISQILNDQPDFSDNFIGKSKYLSDPYFNGSIDDIRIYASVLSNTDISTLSNGLFTYNEERTSEEKRDEALDSGLILNYSFEVENCGIDFSGSKNDGNAFGVSQSDSVVISEASGSSGYFADNKFISMKNGLLTDSFTYSVWINPIKNTDYTAIFDCGNNTGYICLKLFEDGNMGLSFHSDTVDQTVFAGVGSIALETWQNVVLTMDGSHYALYINGLKKVSGEAELTVSDIYKSYIDFTENYIGHSRYAQDEGYNGYMDDIRLYNKALTDVQIHRLAAGYFFINDNSPLINNGIVAHYAFNGKDAAIDYSSNLFNGINNSVELECDSKINEDSLSYGVFGTNKYLTLPNIITGDFSVSLWARPSSLVDYQRLFDFGKGDYYIALYQYADGNIGLCYNVGSGNESYYATPGIAKVNTWAHYVVTVSQNNVNVYVNNELVLTVELAKTISEILTLQPDFSDNYIGKSRYDSDPYFNGFIDDVRVYNRVINTTVISMLSEGMFVAVDDYAYKTPSLNEGLINHYTFDSNVGIDYSGNSNNASISNGVTLASENGVNSKSGSYALFNGINSGLRLQNNILDKNTNAFSIATWVRFDELKNFVRIFDLGVSNRIYLTLWSYEDGGAKLVISASGSNNQIEIGTFLNVFEVGKWVHLTFTMKDNETCFYINGELVLSKTISLTIQDLYKDAIYKDHTQNFIGVSHFVSDSKFAGAMDEIRIYNRALPEAQVKYIKNNCFGSSFNEISDKVTNLSSNKNDNINFNGNKELSTIDDNYFTLSSWNTYISQVIFDSNTEVSISDQYGFNKTSNLTLSKEGIYILCITKDNSVLSRYKITITLEEMHKVSFVADGFNIQSKFVLDGDKVSLLNPKKVGYEFAGWYTDSSFTTKVDPNIVITFDLILYAKWVNK